MLVHASVGILAPLERVGTMAEPVATPSLSPGDRSRRYHGWALAIVALGVGVSLFAMLSDSGHPAPGGGTEFGAFGNFGLFLYFATYIALLVADWPDFRGAIFAHRWGESSRGRPNGYVAALLYVCVVLPFVLPFYPFVGVVQYARGYGAQRKRYPLEQRLHVAQLEAEVGIAPETAGECPRCGKPLQVDAEFCAFCGAPVRPQIRVCPKCSTVALPGAEFCPRCGTALDLNPHGLPSPSP